MIKLSPRDREYPERLREMKRPPDPLWVWGRLPEPRTPTVGIVGTRRLTEYGRRIARTLAGTLARAGAVIVSGLAQGIDSTAHAGALDAKGTTIAVLGEGLAWYDQHGPLRRRQLAQRIRQQGVLVSEYPLDLRGTDWTYPRRNATIAGLSDVLVVVEAPDTSGALITAERMKELLRPVFIVPGPFGSPTWDGSHAWIARGRGSLLANARQITDHLGLELAPMASVATDGLGDRLLSLLAIGPAGPDAIAAALRIDASKATTLIAEHVITGTIAPTADGRFARVR